MNSIDVLEDLKIYPVFNAHQFAQVTGLGAGSAKVRLFRMKKLGRIQQIQRNCYSVLRDPLVIASRIIWPSYISLWYALSFHGLTAQVVHNIDVLTPKSIFRRSFEFMGTTINIVKIAPQLLYGYDKLRIGGHEVFMAYPEKALVDALVLQKISVTELFDMISAHKKELDMERLAGLAVRSADAGTIKRIGFILERCGFDRPRSFGDLSGSEIVALDYSFPSEGPLDKKWNLIVNMEVYE